MIKAELKNYRQSPRKVRLVADLIRGKKAQDALTLLTFTVKRASDPIKKLLESAIANANHNFNISASELFVKEIRVDEGPTLKRWRARAFGRAAEIKKRTSRVLINLEKIDGGAVVSKNKIVKEKVADKVSEKDTDTKTEKTPKKGASKTAPKTAKKTEVKSKTATKKVASKDKNNKK